MAVYFLVLRLYEFIVLQKSIANSIIVVVGSALSSMAEGEGVLSLEKGLLQFNYILDSHHKTNMDVRLERHLTCVNAISDFFKFLLFTNGSQFLFTLFFIFFSHTPLYCLNFYLNWQCC